MEDIKKILIGLAVLIPVFLIGLYNPIIILYSLVMCLILLACHSIGNEILKNKN